MKPSPPAPPPPKSPPKLWLLGALFAGLTLYFVGQPEGESYTLCSDSKNIYTVDESRPRVECIAVRGGLVDAVGTFDELQERRWKGADVIERVLPTWLNAAVSGLKKRTTRVIRVEPGHIVVPGLADAHAHVIENGYMMQLPLAGSNSVQEVINRIKAYINAHPDVRDDPTAWIEGMGWDQTKWPGKKFPTAADLATDPLLRGRPIALSRVDGHARWVSPKVLELMGGDDALPKEVEGGIIERDEEGKATGIFIDNAMDLVPVPEWSKAKMEEFYQLTMREALRYGLTSVHDADAKVGMVEFLRKKADSGELPIRLYLMGNVNSDEYWGAQIPRLVDYGKRGRLNVRSVKLFTDGALGSWGAALLEPYSDNPSTKGIMRSSPEALQNLVERFWEDGWQVNIHCIGDRANRVVLDIFESIIVRKNASVEEWRPRIEHAQIIESGDLERIGRLGVIPSVQPTHATSDMWYAETRLGPERIKGAYAYQTLLKGSRNGVLPLGSDFPVEGVNPLLGFYAAVARLSVDGTSPHGDGGWYMNEALTRAQALKGMTLDAAYASFAEKELGSLTPGKKADFAVLDRDIMTVPVKEILETKVRATVVDGEVVFGGL
ncbi:amidohydrolase family-domain-containing protein [Crucibulum laeve]|uniref:Amidohydrolase family-domain-containing protein n=1 Tax=Crucibulum laeve TaxID=68775 RepID=A0A5C3LXZ1_9AGAR|nr:amidohydrolase family-domain-containing protein [Crucibulum laeve]